MNERLINTLEAPGEFDALMTLDLASPDSKWGSGRLSGRGSNGAAPMIMANWCRRLTKAGLVRQLTKPSKFYNRRGEYYKTLNFYDHHEITAAGRATLRGGQ